jgi:hypothetical protein
MGNKSVVQVVFVLSVARCSAIARETFLSIFSIYFCTYCSNNGGSMIMYRFCMLLDQYTIYITYSSTGQILIILLDIHKYVSLQ